MQPFNNSSILEIENLQVARKECDNVVGYENGVISMCQHLQKAPPDCESSWKPAILLKVVREPVVNTLKIFLCS